MQINGKKSTIYFHLMEDQEVEVYKVIYPFDVNPFDEGIKYLGFHLKPNNYRKVDWVWLLAKLEKRLKSWSFIWLSRAGRLILVKTVLEAIPVYWVSLAWVPKGILEKIRRLCFRFLWVGQKESFVMPWIKWETLATPKLLGGWGLKNIHNFSKALAAKVGWRLITTESLWTKVVHQKYISPIPCWIGSEGQTRRPKFAQLFGNLIKIFSYVISQGLAWRVGRGTKVRIGQDPWPGSNMAHLLPQPVIEALQDKGFIHMDQVADRNRTTVWGKEWQGDLQLGLDEEFVEAWNSYTRALKLGHIQLTDKEDELVWKHSPFRLYTPKEGYTQIHLDLLHPDTTWWWKGIWKVKFPLKAHLFQWCLINAKVPTWDRMKLRGLEGPGWCSLCKGVEETSLHMFLDCPFTHQTWAECTRALRQECKWQGTSIEEAWKSWLQEHKNLNIKYLPLLINWGIWLARNSSIFKDKASLPEHMLFKALTSSPFSHKKKRPHNQDK
jgi:hypothetical protein